MKGRDEGLDATLEHELKDADVAVAVAEDEDEEEDGESGTTEAASDDAHAALDVSAVGPAGLVGKGDDLEDGLEPFEGRSAWLCVLGSFIVHFVVLGGLYSFSLFVTTYEEEFQVGRGTVSLIFQLQVGLLVGCGLLFGPLSDKYGTKPVALFGLASLTVGLVVASFATSFGVLVFGQGILVGVGNSALYWPAITVVPQ